MIINSFKIPAHLHFKLRKNTPTRRGAANNTIIQTDFEWAIMMQEISVSG